VYLASLADEPASPDAIRELKRHSVEVAAAPLTGWLRMLRGARSFGLGGTVSVGAFWSPTLAGVVRRWAEQVGFDWVMASASSLAPYLDIGPLQNVPAVIDLMDVDSEKWLDYAAASRGVRRWLYRGEGLRLRRLEARLAARARSLLLVSEDEAKLLRQHVAGGDVRAVPNGVDLEYFQPRQVEEERAVVFVGAMNYRPNVDAACWFVEAVWPQLRQRVPGCEAWFVGHRPVAAVRRLAEHAGVKVLGSVPDVRPYVARAALAIAPLQIARGVQNKVLEAMAMGKAVVATPEALTGIALTPGREALEARTPGEWVDELSGLIFDSARRQEVGRAAREFVERRHDWQLCLSPLGSVLGLDSMEDVPAPALVGGVS
jgi:sugar transferase (PEP-CTERM/EpsH1 system associated)